MLAPHIVIQSVMHCCIKYLNFQVLMMSGSHLMVKYTRTTVSWPWRTLVKMMLPCSAGLTLLIVAATLITATREETGFFLMELKSPVRVASGISTETEVTWWCVCIIEEVERRESTAVRCLIQWMLLRPYTLECTQQTLVLVSDNVYNTLVWFKLQSSWPFLSGSCGLGTRVVRYFITNHMHIYHEIHTL